MGSVTGMTSTKILELAANWQQVENAQAQLSAQLNTVKADLQANQNAVNTLNNTTIPNLNQSVGANTTAINNLNETEMVNLQAAQAANANELTNLNTITIPSLQGTLDTHTADLANINNTVVPGLQSSLDANTASINTLNSTTIPGLDGRLGTAETSVSSLQGKFPITAPDISAGAVTANSLAVDAVTANAIAAGSVVAAKIAADAVTANAIAAGAITALKIAAGAVTADAIAADAVTANAIAADSITALKIKSGEISTSHIVALGLDADVIKFGTMSGDRITANTLNSGHIVTAGLDASVIKFGTMSGDRIVVNTLNADKIIAGSITTDRMTANSINGDRIATNTLNADRIITNTLTADKINGNTFTGKVLTGAVIQGGELTVGTAPSPTIRQYVANNPFENQNWAISEYNPNISGWNSGLIWSAYIANDSYFNSYYNTTGLNTGQLKITSPYSGATSNAAQIQFIGISNNETWLTMRAKKVSLAADTMVLESTAADFDINLFNTNRLSFRNSAGDHRINFEFDTLGVRRIAAKTTGAARARMDLWASDIFINTAGTTDDLLFYGNGNSRIALGSFGNNVALQWDTGGNVSVRNYAGSAYGGIRCVDISHPAGDLDINGVTKFGALADGGTSNSSTGTKYVRANANGRLYAHTTAPSARWLKQDIAPLTREGWKSKLNGLEPSTYWYKDDLENWRAGYLADTTHEVLGLPFTHQNESGNADGIDYDGLHAFWGMVCQEQQKEIEELREAVAALIIQFNNR